MSEQAKTSNWSLASGIAGLLGQTEAQLADRAKSDTNQKPPATPPPFVGAKRLYSSTRNDRGTQWDVSFNKVAYWRPLIDQYRGNIPAWVFLGHISMESGGTPNAPATRTKNNLNELGLMQLSIGNCRTFSVDHDQQTNGEYSIMSGAKLYTYFAKLLRAVPTVTKYESDDTFWRCGYLLHNVGYGGNTPLGYIREIIKKAAALNGGTATWDNIAACYQQRFPDGRDERSHYCPRANQAFYEFGKTIENGSGPGHPTVPAQYDIVGALGDFVSGKRTYGETMAAYSAAEKRQAIDRSQQLADRTSAEHKGAQGDHAQLMATNTDIHQSALYEAIAKFQMSQPEVQNAVLFDFDTGLWTDHETRDDKGTVTAKSPPGAGEKL